MRELNLDEVESVSGGTHFEDDSVQERIVTIGQRIVRQTSWEVRNILDSLQGTGLSVSEILAAGGTSGQQVLDDLPDPDSCQGQQIMDLIETRDGLLERINELRDPSNGGDPETFAEHARDMMGNTSGVYSYNDYLQVNSDTIMGLFNGGVMAAALERDVEVINDEIQRIADSNEGCGD